MRRGCRRRRCKRVIGLQVQHFVADPGDRPAVLVPPRAGRALQVRTGRVPVADEHRETRLVHDPGVDALQPLVEPAHGLVTPFDAGLGIRFVRPGMRPRSDDRLHRRLQVLEHARHAVAVAVVPARDVQARDADVAISALRRGPVPEGPVPLLALVGHHPGRRVEAIAEVRLVDDVVRRTGAGIVEVLAHFPRIDVHDPIDEMDIFLVEILGRIHGDDRLQRRRTTQRHLDRIEPAPGNTEHADLPGSTTAAARASRSRLHRPRARCPNTRTG